MACSRSADSSQIGKGGDKLIPVFLSDGEQRDHGKELEEWRGNRFKTEYLPLVRPFSAVPDLLRRVRAAGLRIAVASSAKKDEVDKYHDIAGITDLVDLKTSSDDVEESKPAPDIFEIVLKKPKIEAADAVAIGIRPTTPKQRGNARIATIGVLCGGFPESSLRQAGCVEIYPGPATLFAHFADSLLAKARAMATILATQSAETRAKGEALIRQADKLLCESWNERMNSRG